MKASMKLKLYIKMDCRIKEKYFNNKLANNNKQTKDNIPFTANDRLLIKMYL